MTQFIAWLCPGPDLGQTWATWSAFLCHREITTTITLPSTCPHSTPLHSTPLHPTPIAILTILWINHRLWLRGLLNLRQELHWSSSMIVTLVIWLWLQSRAHSELSWPFENIINVRKLLMNDLAWPTWFANTFHSAGSKPRCGGNTNIRRVNGCWSDMIPLSTIYIVMEIIRMILNFSKTSHQSLSGFLIDNL